MACLQASKCHTCGASYLADFRRTDLECPKCLLTVATAEADSAMVSAQARARELARGTALASTVIREAKIDAIIDWLCRDAHGGSIAYQRNLKRFWAMVLEGLS